MLAVLELLMLDSGKWLEWHACGNLADKRKRRYQQQEEDLINIPRECIRWISSIDIVVEWFSPRNNATLIV